MNYNLRSMPTVHHNTTSTRAQRSSPMTPRGVVITFGWVFLILFFLGVMFSGCATSNRLVPKTRIEWTKNGDARIELPKDMEAENISVLREASGVTVEIKNIKVRTNPEAINAAGTAQADAIKAVSQGMQDVMKTGVELGKQAATK